MDYPVKRSEDQSNGKSSRQSLSVLWWATLCVRWWTEEEIVSAYAQGKFSDGTYDYGEVAKFHALRQRSGGRIRRDPETNKVQIQVCVPFGPRLVVRVCDTSSPRQQDSSQLL